MNKRTLGEKLRIFRGELTQKAYAERIGISYRSYKRYEADENIPSTKILKKISEKLGMRLDVLLLETNLSPQKIEPTKISHALKKEVFKKYKSVCGNCGFGIKSILELHHLLPFNSNGANKVENIILLCPNCHKMVHFGHISNERINAIRKK